MSITVTTNVKCEKCNRLATHMVNKLKEGAPDRGWATYTIIATHSYCDVHAPKGQVTRSTHN